MPDHTTFARVLHPPPQIHQRISFFEQRRCKTDATLCITTMPLGSTLLATAITRVNARRLYHQRRCSEFSDHQSSWFGGIVRTYTVVGSVRQQHLPCLLVVLFFLLLSCCCCCRCLLLAPACCPRTRLPRLPAVAYLYCTCLLSPPAFLHHGSACCSGIEPTAALKWLDPYGETEQPKITSKCGAFDWDLCS